MGEPLRIETGELTTEAILEAMHDGRRVVVTMTALGAEHEVTLRHVDGTYYCDTPTRLHRHESVEEMRACIRNMGYSRERRADGT